MEGIKATLECIHQIEIDIGYFDEDIWDIEIGEKVECEIEDGGIRLKTDKDCWTGLFKPSVLRKYFKIVGEINR